MITSEPPNPSPIVPSVADIQRMAADELATPRLRYVVLLVVSATMSVLLGSLWLTEPGLPLRTRIAFGVMVAIALSWTGFAVWVLKARRVLFGLDRVIAARMALVFSLTGAVGTWAVASAIGAGRPGLLAGLAQLSLSAVAGIMLLRAHRHARALSVRKQEIERRLGGAPRHSV
ncbi:MAG: hypothetical protein ABI634_11170 [Acidobacteriota bacterium]